VTTLRRSLSLPLLVLYGLGTTIGAGIYALTGEVARVADMATPLSFGLACALAAATALSFGELASRFPVSAGEAAYLRAGFGSNQLARIGGLLVVLAGSTSAATIASAAAGYLADLTAVPLLIGRLGIIVTLGGIAIWGIRESVLVAAAMTLVEIAGVLLVTWVAGGSVPDIPARVPELWPTNAGAWSGVFAGGVLAFYAFLGFEDMVNVAEEVKRPRRNVPLGIIITLVLTTLLYVAVSTSAVLVVPPAELAESPAPLRLVYERGGGHAPWVINAIALVGMVNGVLVQIVMASRVLYGLASQGDLPAILGRVNTHTRTPVIATVLVTLGILGLALSFGLARLALATSLTTLLLFTLVNLALVRLQQRGPAPEEAVRVWRWVPLAGAAVSAFFLIGELAQWW
jgi:amino acid transporter